MDDELLDQFFAELIARPISLLTGEHYDGRFKTIDDGFVLPPLVRPPFLLGQIVFTKISESIVVLTDWDMVEGVIGRSLKTQGYGEDKSSESMILPWFQEIMFRPLRFLQEVLKMPVESVLVSCRKINRVSECKYLRALYHGRIHDIRSDFLYLGPTHGMEPVYFRLFFPPTVVAVLESLTRKPQLMQKLIDRYLERVYSDDLPWPSADRWKLKDPNMELFGRLFAGPTAEKAISELAGCDLKLVPIEVRSAAYTELRDDLHSSGYSSLGKVYVKTSPPFEFSVYHKTLSNALKNFSSSSKSARQTPDLQEDGSIDRDAGEEGDDQKLITIFAQSFQEEILFVSGLAERVYGAVSPEEVLTASPDSEDISSEEDKEREPSQDETSVEEDRGVKKWRMSELGLALTMKVLDPLSEQTDEDSPTLTFLLNGEDFDTLFQRFFSNRPTDKIRPSPENLMLSLIDLNWSIGRNVCGTPGGMAVFFGVNWDIADDDELLPEGMNLPQKAAFLEIEDLLDAPTSTIRKIIDSWVVNRSNEDHLYYFLRYVSPELRTRFFSAMTPAQKEEVLYQLERLPDVLHLEVAYDSIVRVLDFIEELVHRGVITDPPRWTLLAQKYAVARRRQELHRAKKFKGWEWFEEDLMALPQTADFKLMKMVEQVSNEDLARVLSTASRRVRERILRVVSRRRQEVLAVEINRWRRKKEAVRRDPAEALVDEYRVRRRVLVKLGGVFSQKTCDRFLSETFRRVERLFTDGRFDELLEESEWICNLFLSRGQSRPFLFNLLAWLLVSMGKDIDTALKLSRSSVWYLSNCPPEEIVQLFSVVDSSPEAKEYYEANAEKIRTLHLSNSLDTLGWIFWKKGDIERARKFLNEGLEISEKSLEPGLAKVIRVHLEIIERTERQRLYGSAKVAPPPSPTRERE